MAKTRGRRRWRLAVACAPLLAACAFGADSATPVSAEPSAPETFHLAPARPLDLTHDRNLFVVGYAHLDTQWRWTYPQVIREFLANTLHDNFQRFGRYPNYVFNFSGSRRYEMMEEYYPADFAKLKDLIAAGRWFPAGSSVDEADTMVPSAESLIRHVLYGNRYFRREFGVASDEFLLPDCFGFPYALPTILSHAGLKGFSTQKLTWGSPIGIPFKVGVWEGPDGSSVVAALDPGGYTSLVKEDLSQSESWRARIEATGAASGAYVDYHYFGTGDKGGAPAESSIAWIERSITGTGPVRVIPSRANEMFDALRPEQIAKLPRYKGELLLTQHSAGSISSEAYMKRWNRKNELLADAAERASVAAQWLGATPYPSRKLYQAWDLLLGSQMHDMLPGTSLPLAYEFCWNDEILAGNLFSAAVQQGVGGVAAALDTRTTGPGGVSLVVYNPLSIAREDVVEATVTFPTAAPAAIAVATPDRRIIPAQVLHRTGKTASIAFVAKAEPLSFAVFSVVPVTSEPTTNTLRVSNAGLENARYRVEIGADGDITSIVDKPAGREVLSSPLRLAFQTEKPEQYPAWNMDWKDRQLPPRAYVHGPASIRVVESGPVRVAVEIVREAEGSRFVETVRLAEGGDRVEFLTRIDWQTPESCLKAVFPLAVSNPVATYDTQVGTIERGNNDPKRYEVPQHQWFDLTATDGGFGVAVLNDSKYGSDKPDDRTLRLTLLYTPGVRSQYQDQASQDFGRHDILYAVTSHRGDWRSAQVPWAGARLNQPLLAFQAATHPGSLGHAFSLLSVSTPQVAVEAVKLAEDGDEIVVRFQELTGQPALAVTLHAAGGILAARELDGQERPIGGATLSGGELHFDVRGYGLRAFGLKLAAPGTTVASPVSAPVALPYNEDVVSSNLRRTDGHFDRAGRAYPAEQFPTRLIGEGVEFALGPTADGQPNAVAARGQTIALPPGNYDRLYLLAAADGDVAGQFAVDGKSADLTIQNWTGYVGQWDNRRWEGETPEWGYAWFNPLAGLDPGYTKQAAVAWYASHRHLPTGDDAYRYCYLFKYRLDLKPGARTLTLPNDPRIHVFAATVASHVHDDVVAATPLFDRIDDHQAGAPTFGVAAGSYSDAVKVTLQRPLYWHAGGLHYTLDGTVPSASSPVYAGPVIINRTTTVTAAEIGDDGRPGPLGTIRYEVNDRTAPRVISATATATQPWLRVEFSEPVTRALADSVGNYQLSGDSSIMRARLAPDGMSADLILSAPLRGQAKLTVRALRDTSPHANTAVDDTVAVALFQPVFFRPTISTAEPVESTVASLPVAKGARWTMNTWVRSAEPVENRTLIGGFGHVDQQKEPTGHYFAVFANGIHVWGNRSAHLESTVPVDLTKWQMLTATYDGEILRLFVNGRQVSWVEVALAEDEPIVRVGTLDPFDHERHFPGEIRDFAIWSETLPIPALQALRDAGPGK